MMNHRKLKLTQIMLYVDLSALIQLLGPFTYFKVTGVMRTQPNDGCFSKTTTMQTEYLNLWKGSDKTGQVNDLDHELM